MTSGRKRCYTVIFSVCPEICLSNLCICLGLSAFFSVSHCVSVVLSEKWCMMSLSACVSMCALSVCLCVVERFKPCLISGYICLCHWVGCNSLESSLFLWSWTFIRQMNNFYRLSFKKVCLTEQLCRTVPSVLFGLCYVVKRTVNTHSGVTNRVKLKGMTLSFWYSYHFVAEFDDGVCV